MICLGFYPGVARVESTELWRSQLYHMARLFFNICHLHQWKLAQWHTKFAQFGPRFSQIVHKPSKFAQDFDDIAKKAKFRQIWSHWAVLLRPMEILCSVQSPFLRFFLQKNILLFHEIKHQPRIEKVSLKCSLGSSPVDCSAVELFCKDLCFFCTSWTTFQNEYYVLKDWPGLS